MADATLGKGVIVRFAELVPADIGLIGLGMTAAALMFLGIIGVGLNALGESVLAAALDEDADIVFGVADAEEDDLEEEEEDDDDEDDDDEEDDDDDDAVFD